MSYAPGAPAAVWATPVLDAGAKLTLMYLWSRADHDAQRDHRETTVWVQEVDGETPTAALLIQTAASTGTTTRAVRGHLSKLRKLGLVTTHGRLVKLTPGCQICHRGGAACRCSVDTKAAAAAVKASGRDAKAAAVDVKASLQLNPPVPPTPPSPGDVASARAEPVDKCGLCTIDLGGPLDTWARRVHPDCPAHRDTPDHEEHTHGDTHAPTQPVSTSDPDPGGDGTRGRGGALRGAPSDHAPPTHGEAQPPVHGADPGAGAVPQHGGPAELDLHNPPRELPDHVLAVHARASGRVGLGSPPLDMPDRRHIAGPGAGRPTAAAEVVQRRDRPSAAGIPEAGLGAREATGARSLGPGRLSPELVAAVAAAGDVWGVQLGHQRFEVLVRECVDDLGLTPEELTRGLQGWETMDRARRPPRSQWLYQRNRRAFKAAAIAAPSLYAVPAPEAYVDDPWGGLG